MNTFKNSLIAFLLIWTGSLFGQTEEGRIVYSMKRNMHRTLGPGMEEMKDMIPEYRTVQMELLWKDGETLYRSVQNQDQSNEFESEGGNIRIRMARPQSQTYRNLNDGTNIEESEFMGKKFLISGNDEPLPWKVTGQSKQIDGHLCIQATMTDSVEAPRRMRIGMMRAGGGSAEEERKEEGGEMKERKIVAWFATDIPLSAGPGSFGQLPGLILELDVNDGEQVYQIASIELGSVEENIEKPTKGKSVTREEYRKIVAEKRKEMMEQGGGGGARIFIRQ